MSDQSYLLDRTKPLADSLRVIKNIMIVGAILLVSMTYIVDGMLAASSVACTFTALVLLIAPSGPTNAIYLRAFRTDRATAKLRTVIAGIIGPDFRLSGIRPPREKTSVFLRFLVPGFVALKYAGSKYMELEAGDDWMARLWRSYQSTRIVFIDVRDVTPYVHQEIELTLLTMGVSRCVFLIDDSKTEAEWRQLLAKIDGVVVGFGAFTLMNVSQSRLASRQVDADLKQILSRLPAETIELREGRQFILNHVSEDLLRKSGRPTSMTLLSASLALFFSIVSALFWDRVPPYIRSVLAAIFLALFLSFVTGTIFRSSIRAMRLARGGHAQASARAWAILTLAFLFYPASIALTLSHRRSHEVGPLVSIRNEAHRVSAISSLRTLNTMENVYNSNHPEQGYACSLAGLSNKDTVNSTLDAAQVLPDDLASGQKNGYTFTFSGCITTMVKGARETTGYRITAVPTTLYKTGDRGYCTDESGQIRYDSSGGTNCTELLE